MSENAPAPIDRLLEIMARLRDPDGGCPWDLEQSYATIAPHTIEEAYEVAEAIHEQDMEELKSELGDLMFQVVFYAQMAREEGHFDFNDVITAISDKMISRHPHVFGSKDIESADAQVVAWEETKAEERRQKAENNNHETVSALDGVAITLPALTRAVKLQNRAARVGFDWPDIEPVFDKIHEELDELKEEVKQDGGPARVAEEYGDLMFVMANLGRHLNLEPETVLRQANHKFTRRFKGVESKLRARGKTPSESSLQEMDNLWDQVKKEET
ncbi:nucleoside triphosphate pyrophosphohydrolase [Sneathiella chinensis]|uniref:Nucleoside triphosphate pyrophosphohydrolase n=1 Tax=Sneathiella chinensis TaxID=349750 RepID=A0ABQ5U7V1_9PROT|nr:nucleoside triphosphate pyrophosphohydrolase [Sneathiella chinensis]GLQ07255.1 nucleoside triphosphate pyrophosphohydrolase [Sneathiella chinensis]